MMRNEFEKHVREFAAKNHMSEKAETQLQKMSTHDYTTVEVVYTYHPSISNIYGKEEIATLFTIGGMAVMYDMLPRAEAVRDVIIERDQLASKVKILDDQLQKLKGGSIDGNS